MVEVVAVEEAHQEVVGVEEVAAVVTKVVVVMETLRVALEEVEVAREVPEAAVALVATMETGPVVLRDSLHEADPAAL